METWILVADEHRGRILSWGGNGAPIYEICDFFNHESTAGPSMGPQAVARRNRHSSVQSPSFNPGTPKASLRFAQQLAAALDAARLRHAFGELVLVAPPRFLGVLRPALAPASADCVVRTLQQQLIDAPVGDIRAALLH